MNKEEKVRFGMFWKRGGGFIVRVGGMPSLVEGGKRRRNYANYVGGESWMKKETLVTRGLRPYRAGKTAAKRRARIVND